MTDLCGFCLVKLISLHFQCQYADWLLPGGLQVWVECWSAVSQNIETENGVKLVSPDKNHINQSSHRLTHRVEQFR